MMHRSSRALAATFLSLLAGACGSTPSSPPITREAALETFHSAWETVGETHFDPEFNGVDWEALREELEPRAAAATTQSELRAVLGDMLGRLGQSHFVVIPEEAVPADQGTGDEVSEADKEGDLGFEVRLREGRVLVTGLRPGGPAERAGVRLGWSLVRLDGLETAPLVDALGDKQGKLAKGVRTNAWSRVGAACLGRVGEASSLEFSDLEGRPRDLELVRDERDAVAHVFGVLPTFYLQFSTRSLEHSGLRVGYVHFTNWFLPMVQPLHEALEGMRGDDGVVIDLRGNTGGAAAMVMGVAGHFFDEQVLLGTQTLREGEMRYVALPRQVTAGGELLEAYGGPLAILIDETTGSASEVFAGGMQSTGRARIFGEDSAGAVLPATFTTLPNGDALLHAFGDFKTSDGTLLEGPGVIPDQPVPMTREALRRGVDPQLEAALEWISTRAGGA